MVNKSPAQIASLYVSILKAFVKRSDVQNGKAISYHDNQDPNGNLRDENWVNYGDARVTTGFCVSVSQALLRDQIFQTFIQSRGAMAKLISIDIKEQFYGHCKPSYVQNKWHTAILLRDSGINFVLDATCAQFGNQFVGKFVWDFTTWESTFRSPTDTHEIKGFVDMTNVDNIISFVPEKVKSGNYEQAMVKIVNAMHDVITIDEAERKVVADFFLNGIEVINRKLQIGNLTDTDFKYMNTVNNLLKQFNFTNKDNEYFVMKFAKKQAAVNWISRFQKDGFILPIYVTTSKSIKEACSYFGFDDSEINCESQKDETYIVMKFKSLLGCDLSNIIKDISTFLPYGISVDCNIETDIYNGGKELSETTYGIQKKTNTIFINVSV